VLIAYPTDDTLQGYEGDDTLYGRGGDDSLDGGSGNDVLQGETGNDTLSGGSGNDMLYGGSAIELSYVPTWSNGDDTYLFGRGSGSDTIFDRDVTPGNVDSILLDVDLSPGDVGIGRLEDDLVLSIGDTDDTLTVKHWFRNESIDFQVEEIRFGDGTIWDVGAIKLMALQGTPADDALIGYSSADTINGLAGDDEISGGAGADILDGGAGNDALNGGIGDDTYHFGRGSGQDVITDYDITLGNLDTILLSAELAPSDVTLRLGGRDLFISINGTDDRLQLAQWSDDEAHKVERLQFGDGTVWDTAQILEHATIPTGSDDYIVGTPDNDVIDGGSDEIYGREGDDTLLGGTGNDALTGESGTNLLQSRAAQATTPLWRMKVPTRSPSTAATASTT